MKHRDIDHFAKHPNVSVGLISAAEGLFSLVSVVVHRHPGVVDCHEVAVLACRQVWYSYTWQLHRFHNHHDELNCSEWVTNQLLGGLHHSPSPSYMFPQSKPNRCSIVGEKHKKHIKVLQGLPVFVVGIHTPKIWVCPTRSRHLIGRTQCHQSSGIMTHNMILMAMNLLQALCSIVHYVATAKKHIWINCTQRCVHAHQRYKEVVS